ncbi:MAG: hypothetical protein PHD70_06155 [Anaerostipes sp.]|jgi:hypothetical protein|nr:hypothetical protein [Anaerostipes sp.]MDD3746042.1 hypothetical protein [Anaerostipes sp.]
MKENWYNNPKLVNLEPRKKELIKLLVTEFQGKDMSTILPNLMAVSKSLSNENISFTNEEIALILEVIRSTS